MFAEYCEVHGNYYGTHKGKLMDIMNRGKVTISLDRFAFSILIFREARRYTTTKSTATSFSLMPLAWLYLKRDSINEALRPNK